MSDKNPNEDTPSQEPDVYKSTFKKEEAKVKDLTTQAFRAILTFNIGLSRALSDSLLVLHDHISTDNLFKVGADNGVLEGTVDGLSQLLEKTAGSLRDAFGEFKKSASMKE